MTEKCIHGHEHCLMCAPRQVRDQVDRERKKQNGGVPLPKELSAIRLCGPIGAAGDDTPPWTPNDDVILEVCLTTMVADIISMWQDMDPRPQWPMARVEINVSRVEGRVT
jgi:hypothetical protein